MAKEKEVIQTGWKEAFGIVFLALCVLGLLSNLSYDAGDVGVLKQPPNRPAGNFIGPIGAWFSFLGFMVCGVTAYLLPVFFGILGFQFIFKRDIRPWIKVGWAALLILSLVWLSELTPSLWEGRAGILNISNPGGELGRLTGQALIIRYLGSVGGWIVALALLTMASIFLLEIDLAEVGSRIRHFGMALFERANSALASYRDKQMELEREGRSIEKRRKQLEKTVRKHGASEPRPRKSTPAPTVEDTKEEESEGESLHQIVEPLPEAVPAPQPLPLEEEATPKKPLIPKMPRRKKAPEPAPASELPLVSNTSDDQFKLPQVAILQEAKPVVVTGASTADLKSGAKVLQETLNDFGIDCQVTNVEKGPVVTRYEVLPAAGVRVEKIGNLSNNIALALKAMSVRVQAPIPGKGVVGIEIPNSKTSAVYLRELLESQDWLTKDRALPLALGKDVAGRVMIADLAEMPHLLIAGATGAGKTVCMNSLLAGLLMSRSPEEMRLMLIDPKIVEFTPYNGLPHLVVPVITDAKKVSLGLRWAINEMEKRYKIFAKAGVRNIKSFNTRPIEEQPDLFGEEADEKPADSGVPARMPYIVIVVDELADLMLAAQAEIENHIARLAQLSRAVGIHMIIATQRPSVNVITGTIKANFPARIAFQVAQKVDSRTILDGVGAEKLLGKGDLLFLPPGSSKFVRAQGSFTADHEIRDIVAFIQEQRTPEYEEEIQQKLDSKTVDLPNMEDHEDEFFEAAVEIIRQTRRASTSSLQRRLRIGYTRAARLMDMLEEKGVVGPPNGSDPREILIDLDGEIPENPELD